MRPSVVILVMGEYDRGDSTKRRRKIRWTERLRLQISENDQETIGDQQ